MRLPIPRDERRSNLLLYFGIFYLQLSGYFVEYINLTSPNIYFVDQTTIQNGDRCCQDQPISSNMVQLFQ